MKKKLVSMLLSVTLLASSLQMYAAAGELADEAAAEIATEDDVIEETEEDVTEDNVIEEAEEDVAGDDTEIAVEMTEEIFDEEEMPSSFGSYTDPRKESGYTKWDCVWLGSYPQAEVIASEADYSLSNYRAEGDYIVDSNLYNKLQNATWKNNETTINGIKYYRAKQSDATATCYVYKWGTAAYRYFKYQPIKWRILKIDGSSALLLADKALDCQKYHGSSTRVAWKDSRLRDFLNEIFFLRAFDVKERDAIVHRSGEREYTYFSEGRYFSNSWNLDCIDKVFLLEASELKSSQQAISYGFNENYYAQDPARVCKSTTFAKAMGAWLDSNGTGKGSTRWWELVPEGSRGLLVGVLGPEFGDVPLDNGEAVRPAVMVNLYSKVVSPAGTVRADGNVKEVAAPGNGTEPTEKTFTDVVKGSFYEQAVNWAVANGVTTGTSPTTFSPNDACKRGQVVAFLWRAYGCPEPSVKTSPFTDVQDKNKYYYKAVLWAVENGVTTGTSPTTFSPEDTVTRGQFVTFLYRSFGNPAVSGSCKFTDVPSGKFYYKPVIWAAQNGVTTGTSPTEFSPENPCTRAQVVTFIYRAMK